MTKRILVLHTGGTISMQADTTGKVITNEHNPMNHVAVPLEGIQVTALDVFNIPSPHITPQHMLQLYQKIKTDGKHFDGVVITHGTVSYTHLRAHETRHDLVCRLLLEKKKQKLNFLSFP